MLRDVGAGRLGPITRIGMGTFVDPRETVCICCGISSKSPGRHLIFCGGYCIFNCMAEESHYCSEQSIF